MRTPLLVATLSTSSLSAARLISFPFRSATQSRKSNSTQHCCSFLQNRSCNSATGASGWLRGRGKKKKGREKEMLDKEVKGQKEKAMQLGQIRWLSWKGALCLVVNRLTKWECWSIQRCILQARSSLKGNEGKRADYYSTNTFVHTHSHTHTHTQGFASIHTHKHTSIHTFLQRVVLYLSPITCQIHSQDLFVTMK